MQAENSNQPEIPSLRERLDAGLNDIHSISARYVNLILVAIIVASVGCSMMMTIKTLPAEYYINLKLVEGIFVTIFLVEYLIRIYSAPNRLRYIFSSYGIIVLLAILPALVLGSNETFALRLIRTIALFRSLKLMRYAQEVEVLLSSLGQSTFILAMLIIGILMLSLIGGNIIFLVEPERFASAFEGMWWSLVTMSTVGYGDYVPHTAPGRIIAGIVMILGIVLFAVVTGLISSRILEVTHMFDRISCRNCRASIEPGCNYCSQCGIQGPAKGPDSPERDSDQHTP